MKKQILQRQWRYIGGIGSFLIKYKANFKVPTATECILPTEFKNVYHFKDFNEFKSLLFTEFDCVQSYSKSNFEGLKIPLYLLDIKIYPIRGENHLASGQV